MKVLKNNGTKQEFDISKVRQVIHWATDNIDVNPLILESEIDIIFEDGMKTSDIQENLIQHALRLTSIEEPDWKYVAGRLLLMTRWKSNLGFKSFPRFVERMTNIGLYDNRIMNNYTDDELEYLGTCIDAQRDLDYDYAGANLLIKRYLLEGESPQTAIMAIACLLALPELEKNRLQKVLEFYDAISLRQISLATPLLMNLRKPNGNLSSCFIISVDDSLDSITHAWEQIAKISQEGGGVGVNISRLRARGAAIRGNPGCASGPVPCIKVINDIAVYINQLNSRVGAVTVALDVWHKDILDFLEIQHEVGDIRNKSFDIFPQVVGNDAFMKACERKSDWPLVCPFEVKTVLGLDLPSLWGEELELAITNIRAAIELGQLKNYKLVDARALIKRIMINHIETGLPYFAFKDTINRANPNKHVGYIPSVNLCVESYSNVDNYFAHCCNLCSINLAVVDIDDISEIAQTAVRILDNAIELTKPPITEAFKHNEKYRTIGVGLMGLADWIAKNNLSYSNFNKLEGPLNELMERFSFGCIFESMTLALERCKYPAFEGSDWDNGKIIKKLAEKSEDKELWYSLQDDIDKYGIRNSQLTAIAPNTSSALVQGCSSSILPIYNKFFYDNGSKGTVPIIPPYIKNHFWAYQEYRYVDQMAMNKVVELLQFWIDTGISYELLYDLNNPNIDAEYMFRVLLDAWKRNIKAIYYVRSIQIDTKNVECISCAN